jgi:hypothetical protein
MMQSSEITAEHSYVIRRFGGKYDVHLQDKKSAEQESTV